jgi:hypothetical protein
MADDKEQRKASDVLIDLERKIDNILKIISVYDMNIKIILDRSNKTFEMLNKIHSYINQPQENEPQPISPKHEEPIKISAADAITITETPMQNKRVPTPEPEQQQEDKFIKKVPVVQRVTDSTGKDLFMADVIITNEEGKSVYKLKTNATGRWQALMKPGNYIVNIKKTDSATKKIIEASQNITVPPSNVGMTLPVAIIKK